MVHMKPKELRRDLKMQYGIWKSSQHAALENISGDETNQRQTTERIKELCMKEMIQLDGIKNAADALDSHLKELFSQLNKEKK